MVVNPWAGWLFASPKLKQLTKAQPPARRLNRRPRLRSNGSPPPPLPSPAPTINVAPTLDLRQGVADLLFEDDFSGSSLWQTASSDDGSIAFGNNVLTLAVKQARMSLISMRSASALTDFYLQITMTPSLCRGQDVFGVLVRATSNYNYYRFLVSCNGQLRAERVKNGVMVVIQDWLPTGQIMPGSSQPLQLGVMGLKSEFRVFVNDIFQYYVRDPSWTGGGGGRLCSFCCGYAADGKFFRSQGLVTSIRKGNSYPHDNPHSDSHQTELARLLGSCYNRNAF